MKLARHVCVYRLKEVNSINFGINYNKQYFYMTSAMTYV
jgi:hypothetical protein